MRDFNALREEAIAEREREREAAGDMELDEENMEDPNTNLAPLDELERIMELSNDCQLPFSAIRLPCVAHKVMNRRILPILVLISLFNRFILR